VATVFGVDAVTASARRPRTPIGAPSPVPRTAITSTSAHPVAGGGSAPAGPPANVVRTSAVAAVRVREILRTPDMLPVEIGFRQRCRAGTRPGPEIPTP
jgi:hypothetical protein